LADEAYVRDAGAGDSCMVVEIRQRRVPCPGTAGGGSAAAHDEEPARQPMKPWLRPAASRHHRMASCREGDAGAGQRRAGCRFKPVLLLVAGLPACTPVPSMPAAAAPPTASATRQLVRIAPDPADARCTVRQGEVTDEASKAGGTVEVDRSTTPLEITCRKPGFRSVQLLKSPTFDFTAPAGQQLAYPDVIPVELER
jgi:hypothetical protein